MSTADVAHAWRELGRYGSALRWFSRLLWESFRWRLVRTVVATQLGVLIVGLGLSLSVHYFQQLERDGALEALGASLPARDGATLLAMVAVVLLVLLTGAGVLFMAQRRIVDMAVELNHIVRMRIALAYGGELPGDDDWRSERAARRALWVLQTRDSRRVSILSRGMLRNLVNVGTVVVGLAALFYLEARMTLLFLAVMAVAMVSYYRRNAASARATRRYEAIAPTTRQGLRHLLPSLQTVAAPAPDRAELEAALDPDAVAEETDAFGERFGAHIHAEFLGFAIMGVALAVLLGFLGHQALQGAMPWTRLVAYVLVLRLTMNGIQSLLRTFAFFSRFYPSIDRLNRFFAATSAEASTEPLAPLPLRVGERTRVEDGADTGPLRAGEQVEVVLPLPLSRYSLGLLARALAGEGPAARRRLLGHLAMAAPLEPPPTPASMRSLLTLEGAHDPEALRAGLGEHAAEVEQTVGLDPQAAVPAEAWARMSREARDRLQLAALAASARPIVAVADRLASDDGLARLWEHSDDRLVLRCGTAPAADAAEDRDDRALVVGSDGGLIAVGSRAWVAEQWPRLRELLHGTGEDALGDEGIDDDDED